MTASLEHDWEFLHKGTADLKEYLLSQELYWPLSTGPGTPQFTLGNLLLAQARLSAVAWPPERQAELQALNETVEGLHKQWQVTWSRKAKREYSARYKLWMNYLQEVFAETGRHSAGYASEVRWRAILDLLEPDITEPLEVERQGLASLDGRLRTITHPGPFLWEPEVEPAFPRSSFWYLYIAFKEEHHHQPAA